MRAVIQRVTTASVAVNGDTVGAIQRGFLVLLGVKAGDTEKDADYMADKIVKLRIFEDENGKMNKALRDVGGSVLLVSQFTLLGDARHGRRPSFIKAERPEIAEPMVEQVAALLREKGIETKLGRFRTHMVVSLVNDGPVTILLDSRKGF